MGYADGRTPLGVCITRGGGRGQGAARGYGSCVQPDTCLRSAREPTPHPGCSLELRLPTRAACICSADTPEGATHAKGSESAPLGPLALPSMPRLPSDTQRVWPHTGRHRPLLPPTPGPPLTGPALQECSVVPSSSYQKAVCAGDRNRKGAPRRQPALQGRPGPAFLLHSQHRADENHRKTPSTCGLHP